MRQINGQDPVFHKLVQGDDEITYNLFYLVRDFEASRIYTDDKSYIVAQSNSHTPVWVYANGHLDEKAEEELYDILETKVKENRNVHINVNEKMISGVFDRFAKKQNIIFEKYKKLIAYQCPAVKQVEEVGEMITSGSQHKTQIVKLVKQMTEDIAGHEMPEEEAEAFAEKFIGSEELFLWKDTDIVSMARIAHRNEKYARINSVVTDRAQRGKGYIKMLVGKVTVNLLQQGVIPMLYADDDNPCSNAAYKKLGYIKTGEVTEFCIKE